MTNIDNYINQLNSIPVWEDSIEIGLKLSDVDALRDAETAKQRQAKGKVCAK